MFIANQTFKDEDTLLEMLFDFSLGDATSMILELQKKIERDLEQNEAYEQYRSTLTNEEDRLELETEERYIRLAEALMQQFDSFKVKQKMLFGLKDGRETLLYSIDLV